MDAPFTLSASSVSVDGVPYAEFYIPQSGIKEGNILIAAKKDGVVKWSWHIWVSGADFTPETITNASGKDYCIMPIDPDGVVSLLPDMTDVFVIYASGPHQACPIK